MKYFPCIASSINSSPLLSPWLLANNIVFILFFLYYRAHLPIHYNSFSSSSCIHLFPFSSPWLLAHIINFHLPLLLPLYTKKNHPHVHFNLAKIYKQVVSKLSLESSRSVLVKKSSVNKSKESLQYHCEINALMLRHINKQGNRK